MPYNFITKWNVTADASVVVFPITDNFTGDISWGTGETVGVFNTPTQDVSHIFQNPTGIKTISVSGDISGWDYGAYIGDSDCRAEMLLEIQQETYRLQL